MNESGKILKRLMNNYLRSLSKLKRPISECCGAKLSVDGTDKGINHYVLISKEVMNEI